MCKKNGNNREKTVFVKELKKIFEEKKSKKNTRRENFGSSYL